MLQIITVTLQVLVVTTPVIVTIQSLIVGIIMMIVVSGTFITLVYHYNNPMFIILGQLMYLQCWTLTQPMFCSTRRTRQLITTRHVSTWPMGWRTSQLTWSPATSHLPGSPSSSPCQTQVQTQFLKHNLKGYQYKDFTLEVKFFW